ncbi:AraC family transcriptional regulator [Bradyrhizobium sp. 156]|uniref:AraC family transcriptional regulator n=1 Tax=Bradyrhizobium sp. 156 TaxID=2782630 RepID=UPI001FF86D94|nr:AraC family transcriptional regulator [Bradyrhizobium sp. 156]MCK1323598.1 AraC family transcriptional regulator [Bradyrhizobium sp. 156]
MDPLDDVFAAMRVQSALYARLEVSTPWGISFAAGHGARFGFVVRGGCWMSVEGIADPIALTAGDCYVLARGTNYKLQDDVRTPTRNCFDVIGQRVGGTVELGGGGTRATVITGWFVFDAIGARPLLDLMPVLLHARTDQNRSQQLQATLQQLATETAEPGLGSGIVISRLADMLFVQAIRAHVASADETEGGWLAALADPRLGPALRAMHDNTAHAWTIEALASRVGMSRSAFAARFRDRVGEPPLAYLTRWRMFRAAAAIRSTDQTIAEIAFSVGYESESAFTKAFRRVNAASPGVFRRQSHSSNERHQTPGLNGARRTELPVAISSRV